MEDEMKNRVEEDDGHTIVNMNVDGMPWFQEKKEHENPAPELLQGKNMWKAIFSALGTSLLILFIFMAAIALFILFCTEIWFA